MNEFLKQIKNRRTYYNITNEEVLNEEKLKELMETSIKESPSAFNSQSSRIILLLGQDHKKLWEITLNTLKKIVPEANFGRTKDKIDAFASGYGTVLYFEDQDVVKDLQKSFPLYAANFPTWSEQASGMLQYVVWTALSNEGLGASLQHYNPIIDKEVATTWNVPSNWKLIAQMPFGKKVGTPDDKEYLPIETTLKVYNSK